MLIKKIQIDVYRSFHYGLYGDCKLWKYIFLWKYLSCSSSFFLSFICSFLFLHTFLLNVLYFLYFWDWVSLLTIQAARDLPVSAPEALGPKPVRSTPDLVSFQIWQVTTVYFPSPVAKLDNTKSTVEFLFPLQYCLACVRKWRHISLKINRKVNFYFLLQDVKDLAH